jgi:prolycopene isomerase
MGQTELQEEYDAIIIGSGLAGLTAGALLAKAGKRILLLEKHNQYGGYAQAFKRKGYHFDSSVHFTGGCFPAEEQRRGVIFKTLEMLKVERECTFLPLDPFLQLHLPDFTFEAPSDMMKFEKKLCDTFPEEKKQIKKLLKLCLDIDDDLRHLPDSPSFWDNLLMPFRFPRIVRYGNITLERGLDLFFRSKKLKAIFASLGACFSMPVPRISFPMWSHILVSIFAEQVSYCKGTFQNLANALVQALRYYSGTILPNKEVLSIQIEKNRVKGVVLGDGKIIKTPIVISNADLKNTYENLIGSDSVPEKYLVYIKGLKPSLSCFAIYIGTDLPLHTMNLAHEIFIYDTVDSNKWFHNPDITKDINIIISIPSLTDATVAPKGKHSLSIISLIPYQNFDTAERKGFAVFLISKVNQIIPGLQDHLDFMETATPHTFERYTNNYMGSSLGWECSVDQVGSKRPSLKSPINGLWHTGHWTKPGGGIYGVIVSGRNTAQMVLGYKNATDFVKAMNEID